jgi:STE24 endopeptidase
LSDAEPGAGVVPLRSDPSTAPALGRSLVAVVLACAVAAGVGAVGSAVVRRLSNPVGRYRLLYRWVLAPLGALAYGAFALLDVGAAVSRVLARPGVRPPEGVGVFLAETTTALAAGVVVLAAYAPTVRGVRAVRDLDLPTGRAVLRAARALVGAAVVFGLAITPFRLGTGAGASVGAITGGLVVLCVGVLAVAPYVVAAVRPTERPAGDDAARIERLRDRAGLGGDEVAGVCVLRTDDEETANAFVRGLGPTRRLFVTGSFLEAFDDETGAALLAVQAGHVRARTLERRLAAVLAAVVPLLVAFAGDGDGGPTGALVAVAGVGLLLGLRGARRGVRAADEHAADRVGADAVADALGRYAAVHDVEPSRRPVPNPLAVGVALGDRIDRLRGHGDG